MTCPIRPPCCRPSVATGAPGLQISKQTNKQKTMPTEKCRVVEMAQLIKYWPGRQAEDLNLDPTTYTRKAVCLDECL